MFEKLKAFIKNSYSRSFTSWFGIADWEDGKNFNINNTYNTNAYVNIAINKIATNIIRAKLTLVNDSDVIVESGPAFNLFKHVNSMMSTTQLIEATTSWVLMRGEAIWILTGRTPGTITGVPVEITLVDPQFMHHVLNEEKTGIVLWKFQREAEEIPFLPTEIIHFKQWNPITPWRGVNPLIAMEPELLSDMLINNSNNSLLKNRGVPAGLLTTDEPITGSQAKEIRDMWNKAHGGSSKSGKTAVLGQGTKYTQLALTSADMEYFKSKQWNRGVILGRYGVPAIVAGYKDESTPLSGSDTNEQLKFFWEQTLIPLLKFFESKLDTEFSKRFAPNLHIRFDTSEIAELQDDLELLAKRQREDVKAGILTANEVREQRGLDKVSWGDTWWKNLVFVDVTETLIPGTAVKNNVIIPSKEKNSLTIFNKPEVIGWPELFINQHIWKVRESNKILSNKLYIQLKDWLYDQRKIVLKQLSNNGDMNPSFWKQQQEILMTTTNVIMHTIRQSAVDGIKDIVDIEEYEGLEKDYIENSVCGDAYSIARLSTFVKLFVIDAIESRDMDATRERYKIAQARLHEIADREIETIVNDMRTKIFTTLNLDKALWIQLDIAPILNVSERKLVSKTLKGFKRKVVNKTVPKKARIIIEENEEDIAEAVDDFYISLNGKVDKAIDSADELKDIIAFFVGLKLGSEFVKHMKPVLETVWTNGAKNVYGKKLYDLSIKKSADYIKARGLLLKKSPEFVTDSVINFIENNRDKFVSELADEIKNKWDDITASRAELIAKTETSEALAKGAEAAMDELDIPYKRWVNRGDDKVRDEHLDSATGVYAKVGKPFKNGLDGPGGYNCRCWLEAATEKEAKGN